MQKYLITKGDATSALIKLKKDFLREAAQNPGDREYYHGLADGLTYAVSEILEVPATKVLVLDDKTGEEVEIIDEKSKK